MNLLKSALIILLSILGSTSYAQNTFPSSGYVGIGNTTPGLDVAFKDVNSSSDMTGLTWYSPIPADYGIYRTPGVWAGPNWQQLKLGWITGILLDPGTVYGKSYVDVVGNGLRVTAGSLGVGTTDTKGYKFAVAGSGIMVSLKVKPQSAWPDYVFEKEYRLPAIDSVGRFVRENKHLPGIPTAAEVADDGIDVGDMSGKLLKKIEELTLYLVSQDEKIRKLQEEIAAIKKQ